MTDAANDFAAQARRYWGQWDEALRATVAPAAAAIPGLRELLDAGHAQIGGNAGLGASLEHLQQQSQQWLAQMQQLAAGFAGRDHSAADVAAAWRAAFGDSHPFAGLLQGMRGHGLENFLQWSETAAPWLAGMRGEAMEALGLPAFGFAREHQERLQALGRAQLRQQAAQDAYGALLADVSRDAFARFEARLAEREAPGLQIDSVRGLFDLWVDAAEEAWAQAALSPDYRRVFAEMVNAQMQLRAAAQAIGEQTATTLGLPGRAELDSAHRKIAELDRQLRRLQRAGEAAPAAAPSASAKAPSAKTPAQDKRAPRKAAVKKTAPKQVAAKKAVAKKVATAAKPAAKKQVAGQGKARAAGVTRKR